MSFDEQLPQILCKPTFLSPRESHRKERTRITIKLADKNLGIVVMDTDDYITQCAEHLSSNTYRIVTEYPTTQIARSIDTTLDEFKLSLFQNNVSYLEMEEDEDNSDRLHNRDW